MSKAYLKKKHAADKLQREQEAKDRKAAEAAQLAAQRERERVATEARQQAERDRRVREWENTRWERELAKKVEARGGAFCTHGRHTERHRPHGVKPQRGSGGGGRRNMSLAMVMLMVSALGATPGDPYDR